MLRELSRGSVSLPRYKYFTEFKASSSVPSAILVLSRFSVTLSFWTRASWVAKSRVTPFPEKLVHCAFDDGNRHFGTPFTIFGRFDNVRALINGETVQVRLSTQRSLVCTDFQKLL